MKTQKFIFILSLILGLMVLALLPEPVAAGAPGKVDPAPRAAQAGDPPPSEGWWAAIQEEIRRTEYHVSWQKETHLPGGAPAYQAPNRAQNLRTYFTPEALQLEPRVWSGAAPPWRVSVEMAAWGRGADLSPVGEAALAPDEARIRYERAAFTERYLNSEAGLAYGIRVARPLCSGEDVRDGVPAPGCTAEPLRFAWRLSGDLAPRASGGGVDFAGDGEPLLRWGDLRATDADGRLLPAALRLEGDRLVLEVDDASARYPLAIDATLTGLSHLPEMDWYAESNHRGAHFGFAVGTAGDVDGDGFADLVVGAPDYDAGQPGAGAAFVYHGSALGLADAPAWQATGGSAEAHFGTSVGTAGDVDDDGFADLVVGAPDYDGAHSGAGAAFVYYGSAGGLADTPAWNAEGDRAGARFGFSVATAGQVNGDAFADLIVGAPGYTSNEEDEGAAFVYHGSASGLLTATAWFTESNVAGAQLGFSVASAGDVTSDTFDSVVVGAPYLTNGNWNDEEGMAYLFNGTPAGLQITATWQVEGAGFLVHYGWSVSGVGDVNADGYADFVVGAPGYEDRRGKFHIYLGSSTGPQPHRTINGLQRGDAFGWSVGAAGDVNGDGYADFAVGAPHDRDGENRGAAYLYYGYAGGLDQSGPYWQIAGDQEGAYLGHAVGTAGDVNGDGFSDVVVGAYGYDYPEIDEGAAFVYYGSPSGADAADWMLDGQQAHAQLGAAVNTAGDVNGDGYADLLVGAKYFDDGHDNEGAAYLYLGSPSGPAMTYTWSIQGEQGDAYLGRAVGTAGDVNGDGYADLVVGAYGYNNGQTDEGRLYVALGSPTGPLTETWIAESDLHGACLGYAVGTAGDVNGDGFSDLVAGAYGYDNVESDEGAIYLYLGSPSGLVTATVQIVESNVAGSQFGSAVGTAGDLDGDGFADLLVGAPRHTDGESYEGAVYVYYGSPTGIVTATAWMTESNQAYAYLGHAVGTAGDVDGDGFADVAYSAYNYDTYAYNEGRVCVHHGSPSGVEPEPRICLSGPSGSEFGSGLATAGDVNGDGFADLVVGARSFNNGHSSEGAIYLYTGSPEGLGRTPAWHVESNRSGARLGDVVGTAGDVNGDGFGDVVAGAPEYTTAPNLGYGGRVYLYFGGPEGLRKRAPWSVVGQVSGAAFGYSLGSAGDVNGDGFDDVAVGAYAYDGPGAVFLYYGGIDGPSTGADLLLRGPRNGARFGYSVESAGDVNGDGFGDLVVGAPVYENGESAEGAIYLYHGAAAGLSATPAMSVESNLLNAHYGFSVRAAGDVNADGFGDVVAGAPYCSNPISREGCAYVHHGSASGLNPSAALLARGEQGDSRFGYSVDGAGDVNGDGYDDVLVGAYAYNQNAGDDGAIFVFYGGPGGVVTETQWIVGGGQGEAYLGYSVSGAGDVNGDGFADVLAGSHGYNGAEWDAGRALLFYGSSAGLSTEADWSVSGWEYADKLGQGVASAGDTNGDGFSEIMIYKEGYYYESNVERYEGLVYVYYGSAYGPSATPDWTIEGNLYDLHYGRAMGCAGDVNGDGYDDVLFGTNRYDYEESDVGVVDLYYGSIGGLSDAGMHRTYESHTANAGLGYAVGTAGDVDGDGLDDLLVGAPYYDAGGSNRGAVFVHMGRTTGIATTPDRIIAGEQDDAYFGYAVGSAGDVNGDGFADVIAGAPYYDAAQWDAGAAFVYAGSTDGLSAAPIWTATGDRPLANFGTAVGTAGDVNGDGLADIVVGAPHYENGEQSEGAAFLFLGSTSGPRRAPQRTIEGNQAGARLGYAVGTAGDVDADGLSDVVVSAPYYDTTALTDTGRVEVYAGTPLGIAEAPLWSATGDQPGAHFGASAATAGDTDGDGYADLVVGAPRHDAAGDNAGYAALFAGGGDGLSAAPVWAVTGLQSGMGFGTAVGTAGDVNGDGLADIVVGAPGYDGGERNEGALFVYHGSAGGLHSTPLWRVECNRDYAYCGFAVNSAGDVNGDGYADLVAGVPLLSNGENGEGAFMIHYSHRRHAAPAAPRQLRPGDGSPIAPLGLSDRAEGLLLALPAFNPLGSNGVRLEWQIAPVGASFTSTAVISGVSAPLDGIPAAGSTITHVVAGLAPDTPYHWRARLRFPAGNALGQVAGRWKHAPRNGWTETDFRTLDTPFTALSLQSDAPTALGGTTTFTATHDGAPQLYAWSFGDGSVRQTTDPVVTYTYATTGRYTALVTATNTATVLTATTTVTVTEVPVAGLAAYNDGPTPIGEPTTLNATVSAGTNVSFTWDFGDGKVGHGATVQHTYAQIGTYTATVTAANDANDLSATTRVEVTARPAKANFGGTPISGPAPLQVRFVNASTGDYDACTWHFGDGKTSADCADQSHTYARAGVYTVRLQVSGSNGQDVLTRTNYVTATAPSAPVAGFTGTPRVGPAPLTVYFTDESIGNVEERLWDFGDGVTSTLANPSHVYSATGEYTVSLTVRGSGLEDVESKTRYVQVSDDPLIAAFSANPTAGPAPLTVHFTDDSYGEVTGWLWHFGDGVTSTQQHPVHTYATHGSYTVRLTISGPEGSDTLTQTHFIEAYADAEANFEGGPLEGPAPLAVTFTDLSVGSYTTCAWEFGDGSDGGTCTPGQHTYTAPGTYTVTLTVDGGAGGRSTLRRVAYVVVSGQQVLDQTIYLPLVVRQ